ncbi:MAG TPA: HAD family hydrolase, partial [Rhodopila sp.]|nr:HAD family hydrolase [Rhodopila sp.]
MTGSPDPQATTGRQGGTQPTPRPSATEATIRQCVVRIGDPDAAAHSTNGRSRLFLLLREIARFGVSDVLLLQEQPDFPADCPSKLRVERVAVPPGAGTAAALWQVRDRLHERFLLSADATPFGWNLARLLADAARDDATVLARLPTQGEIGVFRQAVTAWLQPPRPFRTEILPLLAERGLLRRTALPDADALPPPRRKALFLDRDGVLNIDHGYVGSRDRFEWTDGALAAIRHATETGWHVFIVTNQSGVARGLYSEAAVRDLLAWMADQARAAGGTIDDVRYCPFHPDALVAAYRQAHPWRKPLPGMLLDLIHAWDLDPAQAVMVGD